MSRHTLILTRENRMSAHQGVDAAVNRSLHGRPWVLELREAKRSDEQNNAIHGLIDQILKQRPHHCGLAMSKESYKAIFMHALGQELVMLPTLAGDGMFPLGLSTSKLTVTEGSDLIEYMLAWCAREGLVIEHFDGKQGSGEGAKYRAGTRAAA